MNLIKTTQNFEEKLFHAACFLKDDSTFNMKKLQMCHVDVSKFSFIHNLCAMYIFADLKKIFLKKTNLKSFLQTTFEVLYKVISCCIIRT